MKRWILHSLALLFLWAAPSAASSICAHAVAAAPFQVGGDWEGTGLTEEIFKKWLQALPESPVGERVARVALDNLTGWSEWEIAQAINAGLEERTPHDRLEPAAAKKKSDTPETRIGIGIEYSFYRDFIVIERVVEDSPAAQNGLMLGDQIEQFEEWTVSEHGVRKVAMQISVGDYRENKPVKVVVRRGQQLLNFELTPFRYEPHPDVRVGMLQMGQDLVGVITLRNFKCPSVERDVARGLDAIRKAKADGLILDLRGNPGGLLDVAKKLAGYFLGKKKLLISEEPLVAGVRPADHITDAQSRIQVPMLVLVDSASASASEVLAGVLQYYQVAYLVGTPTYGKGSIQSPDTPESTVFEGLPVTLYATSALYYLPCGTTPQHRGLIPDFEVQQPFPTRAQFLPREQDLRNSVTVASAWDPGPTPDPLRDWLRNSPRTPRMQLPDGDIQKEVALKILSEWIALKKPRR
jgi:carboxyl-terminal processing protease